MNSFRNILLHVDSSSQFMNRLAVARLYAARFGAEVTGLYAVTPWLLQYPAAIDGSGEIFAQLSAFDEERRTATRNDFLDATLGDSTVRWAQLRSQSPYDFALEALCSDLVVLGQRNDNDPARDDVPTDFAAHTLFKSGKPTLVVPVDQQTISFPSVVVVAWNNTRESARALCAALPILRHATLAHIVCWRQDEESGLSALAHHLGLHGVRFDLHVERETEGDIGADLLDFARRKRADLLIMGCYGHSRAREWVFGGVTKRVLKSTTLPVLMCH